MLDLNKTGFVDIVGRLKEYEERVGEETQKEVQGKLMLVAGVTVIHASTVLSSSSTPEILIAPLTMLFIVRKHRQSLIG